MFIKSSLYQLVKRSLVSLSQAAGFSFVILLVLFTFIYLI